MTAAQGHRGGLRRGVVKPFAGADGRSQVSGETVTVAGLEAAARAVSARTGGALCPAEADDEVQDALVRAWLSGRGLRTRGAIAELSYFAGRRARHGLRGDRSWTSARHRGELRMTDSFRRSSDGELRSVIDTARSDAVDADVVLDAVRIAAAAGDGPLDRAALAVVADAVIGADAARELGVSPSLVSKAKRELTQRLSAAFAAQSTPK